MYNKGQLVANRQQLPLQLLGLIDMFFERRRVRPAIYFALKDKGLKFLKIDCEIWFQGESLRVFCHGSSWIDQFSSTMLGLVIYAVY